MTSPQDHDPIRPESEDPSTSAPSTENNVDVPVRKPSPAPIPILAAPPADLYAPFDPAAALEAAAEDAEPDTAAPDTAEPEQDAAESELDAAEPELEEAEGVESDPAVDDSEPAGEDAVVAEDDVVDTDAPSAEGSSATEPKADEAEVERAVIGEPAEQDEPTAVFSAVESPVQADRHDELPVLPAQEAQPPAMPTPHTNGAQAHRKPAQPPASSAQRTAPKPASQVHKSTPTSAKAAGPHKPNRPANPKKASNATFADFEDEQPRKHRAAKTFLAVLGVVVVAAGAYAAGQWAFSDAIAKGTTVAGVDVGGKSEDAAAKLLNERLQPALEKKLALQAGDLQTSLVPADSGISLDAQKTVAGLTGFTLSPKYLWDHIVGGGELQPALTVDSEKLDSTIESISSSLKVEPVDGTVSFVDGNAVATDAVEGSGIDPKEAEARIVDNLFTTTRPVELTTSTVAPAITQEITDRYLEEAQKIASASVKVEVADQTAEVPAEAFTKAISVKAAGSSMNFEFDGEELSKEILSRTTDLLTQAEDAKFVFENGKPVIKGGKAGTKIDPEELATSFGAAAQSDNRTAKIELISYDPQDSVKALEELGIKEKVSSFSTPVPNVPIRTKNLQVAAERVTGTLVKPGEEFDLTDTIGPITAENGYFGAGVIVNGVHTEGIGGGLSQMSTTTYNAGFFAGMTDITHRPHSVWFDRYPAGRESTLFVGSINMIWRNDSDTGILLRSYISGGQLTVEAWGTKTYEVTSTTSPKREVVAARTVTSTAANCEAYPKGNDGFLVTVTRKVKEISTGKIVADEAKSWRYAPDNGVVCKRNEPKKSDAKTTSSKDDQVAKEN